jgi:hypothetical protein
MPSLSKKDRVPLCLFTFSDGRRCRTPRVATHPHFCHYHAQKEAQSLATQKLSNELTYFFSGSYLAACDLSTALSRIIPAVIRGDVKPKTARTIAYLAQTLLQSIRISQHEFINAYSTDTWRNTVRDSVKSDRDYLFPPKPAPAPKPAPPSAPPPNPTVPSPSTPPISTVATAPAPSPVPAPAPPRAPQNAATPTPASPANDKPRPQTASKAAPTTSQAQPIPAPQPAPPAAPPPQPTNPPKAAPPTPQQYFDPKTGGLHFDHNYRLTIDGKPW